jgi:hypothetical protein
MLLKRTDTKIKLQEANEDEDHIEFLEVKNFLKINKHKKHVLH